MGIDISKKKSDELQQSVAKNFFHNYNIANTFGERFDAASRYA
jgi:hypothetical protein